MRRTTVYTFYLKDQRTTKMLGNYQHVQYNRAHKVEMKIMKLCLLFTLYHFVANKIVSVLSQ